MINQNPFISKISNPFINNHTKKINIFKSAIPESSVLLGKTNMFNSQLNVKSQTGLSKLPYNNFKSNINNMVSYAT